MKKLHLALSTHDISASIVDYSERLGCDPYLYVHDEYALWRTDSLNISVRLDFSVPPGQLRHLGWEDQQAKEFSTSEDINGIVWEHFTLEHQLAEIEKVWPGNQKPEVN